MEEALTRFHPFAIDLSSSVETDGVKDSKKSRGGSTDAAVADINIEEKENSERKKADVKGKIWSPWRAVYTGNVDECGD